MLSLKNAEVTVTEELNKWLEEKRREILDKHYNQYNEGYLDAIMDIQNKIKSLN